MVRVVRSCIQSILKLVNSLIGMVGIAMILYSMWLIRVWQKQMGDSPFAGFDYPAPWFIYAFLGVGVVLCVITCSGHIAAETANGCCLCVYMVFIFFLLLLEAGVTADVFLNRDWEEDFPNDPSGSFNEFKDFIRSNFEFCKWIGLSVVSVQGLGLLLALLLRAIGPHQYYDSDDDYDAARAPLLNAAHPRYAVGGPVYGSKK
ncbi:hypothetical protein SLA2020_045680 [Shorea laevis]